MEYTIEPNNESVKIKNYYTAHASYKILNTNDNQDDSLNVYRSVILDPETDKVLCFSPPKSVSMETFVSKCPGLVGVTATKIIEGTMINLFYDTRIGSWEIASKSAVGCNYWYFRTQYDAQKGSVQMTFRDMFVDALCASYGTRLNDIPLIQCLDTSRIYSFVLQHPNNHIVLPIDFPKLYLVAVYEANDNQVRVAAVSDDVFRNSTILQPDECTVELHEEIHLMDYTNLGVMLYHAESGLRTSVENPQYKNIRDIRGNSPNLQYHYLCLSRTGKIKEYLDIFPMYNDMFFKFNKQSAEFIRRIHNAYVTYFVKKRGKDVPIEKSIFRHICALHREIYLPSICDGKKTIITCKIVADYFNGMEPKEQLYHLSGNLRFPEPLPSNVEWVHENLW
jgi:hypothetical protein